MGEKLEWVRKALSGHFTREAKSELDLERIVQMSLATLHFFRPVIRAMRTVLPLLLVLIPVLLYVGPTVGSVFWNGLINGQPLQPNQASVLFLDSRRFVREEIERERGLGRDALDRVARAAGYTEASLFVSGDRPQQRKDAFKKELTPHLAELPHALPAEISWEAGDARRWELLPALSPGARSALAWHWISALILVNACAAAAYFALYRRIGRLPSGTIVLLAVLPLAPFFIDATWNGVWNGRAVQTATAKFLRVDVDETALQPLYARRGLDADVLGEAARTLGIADSLVAYSWSVDADEKGEVELSLRERGRAVLEQRQLLLDEIARAHPEALPVELQRRSADAWRPRIGVLLTTEARRELRGRLVLGSIVGGALFTPLGIALAVYVLRLLQQVNQSLRADLMARVQTLSLRHHAESHVGDAVYRLFQDTTTVLNLFGSVVMTPVFSIAFVPFTLLFLSLFSPWLSLALVVLMVPMLLIGWSSSRRLRESFRTAREAGSALTSRIQETLAAIKIIKAYGAEPVEQARFERASEAAFARAYVARSWLAGLGIVFFLLSGTALILSDSWLALEAAAGSPTFLGLVMGVVGFAFWNLGAFNQARGRMQGSSLRFEQLMITWARAQDQAVGMDRVLELLTTQPEVRNAPDAAPLVGVAREISYRNVSFAYKGDRMVLSSVDLTAVPGSVLAIVGPTGSGKSTLMSLLVRLYDPQGGSIAIDGRNLRLYDLESLRDRIGIALQQNLLFGTTIRENIRYAVPDASDEQVRAAARVACADEFIEALPLGYDTPLGERGTKLSTGQRQRLSIARAVIKDPAVLVLDEPTAALDAETELRVLDRLAEWCKGRVVFLITHRLSTIRRADQIVYLKDGRVMEAGSPQELMARPDGLYRRFVEIEDVPDPGETRIRVAATA